jgi:hypothetical protein
MPLQPGSKEIRLVQVSAQPSCPRCGGEGLLSAQVPEGGRNNRGQPAWGSRVIVLCSRCDADDPAAGALVLFSAIHDSITDDIAEEFAFLLRNWASQALVPDVDLEALEAELEAWHRGELDAEQRPVPGPYLPGDDRLEWPDDNIDTHP